MKNLLLSSVFLFSHFIFSAMSDLTLEGVVVSYNKEKVVLAQDNGKKVKVHRSNIPKHYKLKTGVRVHAVIDSKRILREIKKQEEDKKKTKTKNK